MKQDSDSQATTTYTVFDYSNIDEFVRVELKKNESALSLAKSKLHAERSESFVKYAIGISLIALVVLIGIWLFTQDFKGFVNQSNVSPDLTEITSKLNDITASIQKSQLSEREVREKLNELSERSEVEIGASSDIETQFTVFHTVEVDGEREVVSGWVYAPSDLERPINQYCYLGVPSARGINERITRSIARKEDGQIEWIGNGEAIDLAKRYCAFKE